MLEAQREDIRRPQLSAARSTRVVRHAGCASLAQSQAAAGPAGRIPPSRLWQRDTTKRCAAVQPPRTWRRILRMSDTTAEALGRSSMRRPRNS